MSIILKTIPVKCEYFTTANKLKFIDTTSSRALGDLIIIFRGALTKAWVAKVRARTHVCDVQLHVCVCVRKDF